MLVIVRELACFDHFGLERQVQDRTFIDTGAIDPVATPIKLAAHRKHIVPQPFDHARVRLEHMYRLAGSAR